MNNDRQVLWHAHLKDDLTDVVVMTTRTFRSNNIREAKNFLFGEEFMRGYQILHGEHLPTARIRQLVNEVRKCDKLCWQNRDLLLIRIEARHCTGFLRGYC